MDPIQSIILGIVQGLTEFLPISSSGHLVVLPWAFGWSSPGLLFDTVVHLGTLVAVLIFFWKDIVTLVRSWVQSIARRRIETQEQRLAWLILVATVPAIFAGVLLDDWFEQMFSSPLIVGCFWLVTAALLLIAELVPRPRAGLRSLRLDKAIIVGCAQAIAICPGISRSGATIAAGLLSGLDRESSARFSFLLAIPIVAGAAASQIIDLRHTVNPDGGFAILAIGFLVAAVSGYACIKYLLKYLRSHSLNVFAGYCLIAGIVTIVLASIR